MFGASRFRIELCQICGGYCLRRPLQFREMFVKGSKDSFFVSRRIPYITFYDVSECQKVNDKSGANAILNLEILGGVRD